MELMARYPDNYFELAIVDPPYGIGISSDSVRHKHKGKKWDNSVPCKNYFDELKRVSKNQIIWGGNYFIDNLDNSRCFIVWDKKVSQDFTLAMAELAWTSFDKLAKIFRMSVPKVGGKIHPTQKPCKLYEWLLMNYAKEGDKILDTHLGSMSIAIACHNLGYELTGCELDKEYYDQGIKRVKNHIAQQRLF
jgi:site-specific DNA-methyltransferase (adenine-specific)